LHRHHIIPKHEWKRRFGSLDGVDDSGNVVYLSVDQHAECHRWLFEQYGAWQDRIAYQGLTNTLGKEEIVHQRQIVANRGNKHGLGYRHTDEAKARISQTHIGKQYGLGYRHTDEAKELMSKQKLGNQWNIGRIFSEERKQNISESKMGHSVSEETRMKISTTKTGKQGHSHQHSDATKEKLRLAQLGRKLNPITRKFEPITK
jgi:hypothetical protein